VNAHTIRNSNIAFLAELSSLGKNWPNMRSALGLPAFVTLPYSDVDAHRRLKDPPRLSRRAKRLLKHVLAEDYELFAVCQEFRKKRGWA
jgi:hypothetical protein